jgi:hypothetical protein
VGAAEALGGSLHDRFQHAFGVLIQFVVPDPEDGPSFLREERITLPIVIGVGVLAAIEFDDELRLPAGEVCVIGADWELAGKLWAQAGD